MRNSAIGLRRLLAYSLGATALLAASSPASAVTLLDVTNLPIQFVTPKSLSFTASSDWTTIDFQGYQVPGTIVVVNIRLAPTGGSTNLLGTSFAYTAAACGAAAGEGSLGSFGTNDLFFQGGCEGSYDSLAQTVSTTIGASYTLGFVFSNISNGSPLPNGLRIFATDATAPVPEPATWAMMLVGLGAIGFSLRRRKPVLRIA